MIRILVVSDQPVLARGLFHIIASDGGIEMRTVSSNLETITSAIELENPDILLVDFTPEEHFATLLELRRRAPDCCILLWVRQLSTEMAFQTMKLGVRGILRAALRDELVLKCLRQVGKGEFWFEKELMQSFLTVRTVTLSRRESQLVSCVAGGLKNKEIATALSISEATVRIYLSSLFRKLCVKDRYELAIYGMRNMHPRLDSGAATEHGCVAPIRDGVRYLVLPNTQSTPPSASNTIRPPSSRTRCAAV